MMAALVAARTTEWVVPVPRLPGLLPVAAPLATTLLDMLGVCCARTARRRLSSSERCSRAERTAWAGSCSGESGKDVQRPDEQPRSRSSAFVWVPRAQC